MATRIRADSPGTIHHVTARAADGCDAQRTDADRTDFVGIVRHYFRKHGATCLAWALMSNHDHLAVLTGEVHVSRLMHDIQGVYAARFNRRHDRKGYVFEGRFRSRPVTTDAHLFEVLRYIPLNPLRAGMVPSMAALTAYPWTSLFELLHDTQDPLVDEQFVLSRFGATRAIARQRLVEHVRDGWRRDDYAEFSPFGWAGGVAHVDAETRHDRAAPLPGVAFDPSSRIQAAVVRLARQEGARRILRCAGWNVERIVALAARRCRVSVRELATRSRQRELVDARALAAYVAARCAGAPQAQVARALGMTRQGVSRAIRRGGEVLDGIGARAALRRVLDVAAGPTRDADEIPPG